MRNTRLLLILLFISFLPSGAFSQSLTGVSGLLTIPTAEMLDDGQMAVGLTFQDEKYLRAFPSRPDNHLLASYITLSYFSFLELALRLNRPVDPAAGVVGKVGIGDRLPMIRLRLPRFHPALPAIVIGQHDYSVLSPAEEASHFSASYGVLSQEIKLRWKGIELTSFHLGYGVDLVTAHHHEFVGWFGGTRFKATQWLMLLLEYDAEYWNGGFRLHLRDAAHVTIGWKQFDSLLAGFNINFYL